MDLPVQTNADSSYYENATNFVSKNILVTLASSRSIPAVFHGSRKKPHVERHRFELVVILEPDRKCLDISP